VIKLRANDSRVKPGVKFGKYTILGVQFRLEGRWSVVCQCDCGRIVICRTHQFIRQRGLQCKACQLAEIRTTHGESHTPLHEVWKGMKQRCSNANRPEYSNYGGRGIAVCKEWVSSYEAFRDWALLNGYATGLEIDRTNNDGNYEPSNCRWITQKLNVGNRRVTIIATAFGETKPITHWVEDERCKVCYSTLKRRLQTGWEAEAALSSPSRTAA
jgi:hypothetical protein